MKGSDTKWGSAQQRDSRPSMGFDGQLRCESLADLIQLQCGNRAHAGVCVRSEGRRGDLFFDDGQIVHAMTGTLVGEAAVYEMLEWTGGSFGQSNAPWPAVPTVTGSWQQLLLTAAQRRDERAPGFPAMSTSRMKAVKETPSAPPSTLSSAPPALANRLSEPAESALFTTQPQPTAPERRRRPVWLVACLLVGLPVAYLLYRVMAAPPVTAEVLVPPARHATPPEVLAPPAAVAPSPVAPSPVAPSPVAPSPVAPSPPAGVPTLDAPPAEPRAPVGAAADRAAMDRAAADRAAADRANEDTPPAPGETNAARDTGGASPVARRRPAPRRTPPPPPPAARPRAAESAPTPKAPESSTPAWDHDSPLPP